MVIARVLLGRFIGIGTVAGGFLLLFKGVFDETIYVAVVGGALIPVGMWIMVNAHMAQEKDKPD
ncbi:MAG: hypothetical protein J4G01_04240 [Dehalococcoidia bacterium]|nr:hypothetical protein [Dehalococcoidia bacterium]